MKPKRILITGANGFIGTALTKRIALRLPEAAVTSVDQKDGDLRDAAQTLALLKKTNPDCVFHLAGKIYSRDFDELRASNIGTTKNIIDGLKAAGIRSRLIVPGSAAEYGQYTGTETPILETQTLKPLSPYGKTKAELTSYLLDEAAKGQDAIVARIFNLISKDAPPQSAIGAFLKQIRELREAPGTPEIKMGDLTSKRDLLDIDDTCDALIALAERGKPGEIYNVCSGEAVIMQDVLKRMLELANIKANVTRDPERLRPDDIRFSCGSIAKITAHTGWRPALSLEASLKRAVAFDGVDISP